MGGFLWPDTYISEGIIKVEPQQLPSNLVQSVITQDMLDQIQSMTEEIESRADLTNIVSTYNLYPKERTREPLEDVLDGMRKDIKIDPLGVTTQGHTVPAFKVSFSYPDRHQAMKVVQELVAKFIDASYRNQANHATELTQFLKDQQDTAGKELEAIETQLQTFKAQNNGTLPEQKAENYQKLQMLDQSRANVNSQISRLQNDKQIQEGNLTIYKTSIEELAKIKPEIASQQQQPKSAKLQQAESTVDAWEKAVRDLRERYTDSYPEVKAAVQQLADAKQVRDKIIQDEAAAKTDTTTGKPAVNPAAVKEDLQRQADLQRFQMAINSDDTQIEDLKAS